jgi:hypothetical protein
MKPTYDAIEVARQLLFVREAGENRGLRVEAIQHYSRGQFGDSWCCEFATMVLDICYQGDAPIPRMGACEDVHQLAIKQGWIVTDPAPGDLFLYVTDAGHAHHIGFVTQATPLTGIAGNTSEDGVSSNGDGVHEHALNVAPNHIVFVRLPA